MKNSGWLLRGFLLLGILAMSGCRETYTVVTTLFDDGSCDRLVTVTCDSGKVPDQAFPLPIDSSWEIKWKAPTRNGEKYLFTARKHFESITSLRQEYARIKDTAKIKISINAEKDFRWFYTYFTYTERYSAFNPFNTIPITRFMTQDEIKRYLAGERSDSLKQKRDTWELRNIFEIYYIGLVEAARKLNHPSLPPSLIESRKEELFTRLMASGSDDVVDETAAALQTTAVRKLGKEIKALVDNIMQRFATASKADGDYTSTVDMPGTILDTNSGEVKGNSVAWRFSDEYLGIADYEMRVQSRSVNGWSITVTALVVLALLFLPLGLRRRRERQLLLKEA